MKTRILTLLLGGVLLAGCAATAPTAPALPPTLKPEAQQRDNYNWADRHQAVLARHRTVNPTVVFLGDSITHHWGGEPTGPGRGADSWAELFGDVVVSNLGFGFDYIDNAYYRVQQGELAGVTPRLILVNLGTNNLGHRGDSPATCAANLAALLELLRAHHPTARILVLGIYPRREPHLRAPIAETNRLLAQLADGQQCFYADPGQALLDEAGQLRPNVLRDTVHPSAEGYRRLAKALRPLLETHLAP